MIAKIRLLGATTAVGLTMAVLTAAPARAEIFGDSGGTAGHAAILNLSGGTTLTAFTMGWYDSNGLHQNGNDNYIVTDPGDILPQGFNDYFAFDLSHLSGSFTSASITIETDTVTTSDTFKLGAFGGFVPALLNGNGGVSAYTALGSGALYGSRAYTPADSHTTQTIVLNAAFLSALNGALGSSQFVLGGTSQDFVRPGGGDAGGGVPEPASWAMMLVGFAGLGSAMRSRRRAAAVA